MDRSDQIATFCGITQVSRETIYSLEKYEKLLIKANKSLNLIGKSTINDMWNRHILDSFQVIDFIDKNDKILTDIGTGAGFPGIILALAAKDRKIPLKVSLIDKSSKKIKFLKQVIKELNLEVRVICKNILENEEKISTDVAVVRAFKPLPIVLKLMHKKFQNCKKFFIFLGKTGKIELLQAAKSWNIQYKQRVSVTSNDSIIVEINRLEKK